MYKCEISGEEFAEPVVQEYYEGPYDGCFEPYRLETCPCCGETFFHEIEEVTNDD